MLDITKTAILSMIDSNEECRNLTAEELKAITDVNTAFKYGFCMGLTQADLFKFTKKSKAKKAR